MNGHTYGLSDAASVSGVSIHTLRYYEGRGLMLHPIARDSAGWRRYSLDDVAWIGVLGRLRASGMPIAGIPLYAEAVRGGVEAADRRLSLLAQHRATVARHIEEMQRYLELIDDKVERLSVASAHDQ